MFDPEKITFFAKTDARGPGVAFGIKAKDRQRHMYVVGKTGMGKSTLLENMAAQDIKNGEGMAFIDPHGSAAETLLEYVPEHRVKDVVYFAPFDLEHPISFNVMEDVGHDKRHLVVSGLMSTFKKIWVDAWSARMEYILTNALLALIEYPDTTLLSVNRLFVDKDYRTKVINYIKDPAVKAFWNDEFANYTDRFTAEALPAIQNKIGQFTGNPLIRNIIGQPHSSFDIRKLMDERKILIMNLSKGLIGETNANLLGSMLTTRIYLAAMSRADLPVETMRTMPNFYFYVDEFQSFANATFANILSEARKYHLNLIIAHQYIEQMEEDVRNAVFGNVGTTIAFRVGPFDAEVLETVFAPRFMATDLVNLGFAQIYLTLMIDGIGSQPFSAQTLPPIQTPSVSCRGMVIEESRQIYSKPRPAVEKIVADLHTPQPSSAPVRAPNNGQSPVKKFVRDDRPAVARPSFNNGHAEAKPVSDRVRPAPDKERTVYNREEKPVSQNFSTPKTPARPEVGAKSADDLKQILARIAKKEESTKNDNQNQIPARPQVDRPKASYPPKRIEEEADTAPKKNEETESGSDLKQALARVVQQVGAGGTSEKTPNQPEQINENRTQSDAPTSLPNGDEKIKQMLQTHRDKREVVDSAPTEEPSKSADSTNKPNHTQSAISTVDPSEVKRLLRQNDNQRSPFN
jgi:hypothetical protein